MPFEEIFQWATENFATSLIGGLVLIVLIVYFLFAVVAFIQGREVTVLPMKIGVHPDKQPSHSPANLQVTVSPGEARLSEVQMQQLIDALREAIPEPRGQAIAQRRGLADRLPSIPERVLAVMKMRREVQRKVRELGTGTLDGWAGISIAGTQTFLPLLQDNNFIDKELAVAVGSFLGFTEPANWEDDVSEEMLADIEAFAAEIIPRIPPPPDTPPWLEEAAKLPPPPPNPPGD